MKKKKSIYEQLYWAYQNGGSSAAYKLANELNLSYSTCLLCNCETPTVVFLGVDICGICGSTKNKTLINNRNTKQ